MNQELELSIGQMVMRRVYVIWFCRGCVHSLLIKLGVLSLLFGVIYFKVSPGMILQNAQIASDGSGFNYGFFVSALMNTEIIIQLSFLALVLIGSWLAKDLWSRYIAGPIFAFGRFSLSTLTGFFSRVRF